eukprot:6197078-Pleurochrysis_carterae.AAC.5
MVSRPLPSFESACGRAGNLRAVRVVPDVLQPAEVVPRGARPVLDAHVDKLGLGHAFEQAVLGAWRQQQLARVVLREERKRLRVGLVVAELAHLRPAARKHNNILEMQAQEPSLQSKIICVEARHANLQLRVLNDRNDAAAGNAIFVHLLLIGLSMLHCSCPGCSKAVELPGPRTTLRS